MLENYRDTSWHTHRDRVMETVTYSKTLPADMASQRLGNVNLFMRAIGLDVELLSWANTWPSASLWTYKFMEGEFATPTTTRTVFVILLFEGPKARLTWPTDLIWLNLSSRLGKAGRIMHPGWWKPYHCFNRPLRLLISGCWYQWMMPFYAVGQTSNSTLCALQMIFVPFMALTLVITSLDAICTVCFLLYQGSILLFPYPGAASCSCKIHSIGI